LVPANKIAFGNQQFLGNFWFFIPLHLFSGLGEMFKHKAPPF
jgi:hypothetical protein